MNYASVFCENTINTGEAVCLTAVGASMWPIITNGMRAVISPLKSGLPPEGSLVLIKRGNAIVVHRYWGLTYSAGVPLVLTKGDTNLAFDPPVPVTMVLGQVSLLQKKTGDSRDPNRGWLYLVGRIVCSSYKVGRVWARVCRLLMRLCC
jgi:hypothetical protein